MAPEPPPPDAGVRAPSTRGWQSARGFCRHLEAELEQVQGSDRTSFWLRSGEPPVHGASKWEGAHSPQRQTQLGPLSFPRGKARSPDRTPRDQPLQEFAEGAPAASEQGPQTGYCGVPAACRPSCGEGGPLPPADPPAEKGVPAPLWDGSLYAPSSRDTHTNPHKHISPHTLPGSQNWGIPDRQGTLKMGGREQWRRGCDAVNGRPQLCKHSQGHRASWGRALGCWGTLETGRLSDLSRVHQPNFSQLNPH